MTHDDHLESHLDLCKQIYERMKREGVWPWADSPKSDDVVESENQSNIA